MRNQDPFPIPLNWLDHSDELLVEGIFRWGDKALGERRTALGEDREELLLPAMHELLKGLELGRLVLSDDLPAPGETFQRGGTFALLLEQIACADLGIAHLLANTFALHSAIGAQEQLRHWLSRPSGKDGMFPVGSLVLPSYGESSSLFHGLQPAAHAIVRGDTVELQSRGPVRPQCAGFDADFFGVVSELDDGAGRVEAALIIVPGDAKGLRRGGVQKRTGLAASRDADITLEAVRLPREHVLCCGDEGVASPISWYLLGCSAVFAGAMLAGHLILRDWGENRVIKGRGQVFKNNPLVANQMGRIAGLVESSRLQLYGLAQLLSEGAANGGVAFSARAVSSHLGAAAMDSLDLAMELMASAGYATEWQLERYWRDVKTLQTLLGPQPANNAALARHAFGSQEV
jgi:alkylation response protein AidB-like acyl-CoA dehydrogenase